ncbi:MAG TPA: hypothetical protein VID75_14370, partial [Acidimicrobiales bacterium]
MSPATKITPFHGRILGAPVTALRPAQAPTSRDAPRPGHAPLLWFPNLFVTLASVGLGVTVALVIAGETRGSLAAPGGWLIAGGRLAGFTGAYMMLVM